MDAPAVVTVRPKIARDIDRGRILPASAPVKMRSLPDGALELTVERPCRFSVEPDGRSNGSLIRLCYQAAYWCNAEPRTNCLKKVKWMPCTRENLLVFPSFSAKGVYFALEHDYGLDIESDSPAPREWRVEGDAFVVEFDHAKSLYIYNPDTSLDVGLEICGEDGVWKPGKIRNLKGKYGNVDGTRLIVAADGVDAPKKLRYLHSRPWSGAIYNEVNLPMGAFLLD